MWPRKQQLSKAWRSQMNLSKNLWLFRWLMFSICSKLETIASDCRRSYAFLFLSHVFFFNTFKRSGLKKTGEHFTTKKIFFLKNIYPNKKTSCLFLSCVCQNFICRWLAVNESVGCTTWKVSVFPFFWSRFSRIRAEYGEIRGIPPYSVRMGKYGPEKLLILTLFTQCW